MENAVKQDDYLFDSVHGALTFAYRYSGQQYSPSLMAQMMRGPLKSGKGLAGLDGAAQAGIIRGLMQRLPPGDRHMIEAKFEGSERERLQAMMFFVPTAVGTFGTGMHSRRLADALVQRYFGKQVHLADLASVHGMSAPTMTRRWHGVRKVLTVIWERAEEAAYRRLKDAEIVP